MAFGKPPITWRGFRLRQVMIWVTCTSLLLCFPLRGTEPQQGKELLNALVKQGTPLPAIPQSNGLTKAKITLGRHLFYEPKLAIDGKTSCASCHIQAKAFTDGRPVAIGALGDLHPRNAMSLTNVAYNASLTWADPSTHLLEAQAMIPLFNQHPVEMGLSGRLDQVLAYLSNDARYKELFTQAFPTETNPSLTQITRALASFQRTMISNASTFDAIMFEDAHPPNREGILRGFSLFFSEPFNCAKCHGGFNLSGPVNTAQKQSFPTFHHNGLLGQGPNQDERELNAGLAEHTGHPRDWGKFRAPTLRNIAVTAPYMHNGALPTLEAVLDHYAAGGQLTPHLGIAGKHHPNKSPFVGGFGLSEGQKRDLLLFLQSLTDHAFLSREDLSDPHQDRKGEP